MIKKILIVDDSLVARMMIENSIPDDKEYEVMMAVDGNEGVDTYQKFHPDVTFMDLTMPRLDGFKATEKIMAFDKNAVVVALTADIQPRSISKIKELGAFSVIQKPAKPDVIEDTLASVNLKLKKCVHGNDVENDIFSDEEKDILEEIMNISFGNATAKLAEVIDIFVQLNVPDIEIANVRELPDYIKSTISSYDETTIIDQRFWGEFSGSGLLVLPDRSARELIALLMDDGPESISNSPMAILEKESLLETGNILIGACVGKISELLNTFVTYSPPQIVNEFINDYDSFIDSFDRFQTAIVMKTVFKFEKNDLSGLMLLLTNQESIRWLRSSLHKFLESYR